jgi:hypothetical protein
MRLDWLGPATGSVGDDAHFVDTIASEYDERLSQSDTLGASRRIALERFVDAVEEASERGWDGYDAAPADVRSVDRARTLIESLPLAQPFPDTSITSEGFVTLEWYRNKRQLLSIIVGPDDRLHYSVVLGPATHYGTEPNVGQFPQTLKSWIEKVVA